MTILNKIIWEPSSTIFSIGNFGIHYYSLMFIISFLFGFNIMKRMYIKEKIPTERLETMLFYIVVSTLVGARLGHVIFYDWEYYQNHLLEIFLPIEKTTSGYSFTGFRGLASHGAAIGILTGIIVYQNIYKEKIESNIRVLIYHDFKSDHEIKNFKNQILSLKKKYEFITPDEFEKCLKNKLKLYYYILCKFFYLEYFRF